MATSIKSRAKVKDALKAGRFTVIYFTAKWCGPCKVISPAFESLTQQYAPQGLTGLKVDVDDADKDLLEHFQVEAMPTFVFIRGKEVVYTQQGASTSALKTAFALYVPEEGTCACGRKIQGGHHPERSMCTSPMCDKCVWLTCKACSHAGVLKQ